MWQVLSVFSQPKVNLWEPTFKLPNDDNSLGKYEEGLMHSTWLINTKVQPHPHALHLIIDTKVQPHPHALHLIIDTKGQPHPHALHLTVRHKRTATPTCTPSDWLTQKDSHTHMHSIWVISTKVQPHPQALHLIDQHRSTDAPTCTPFEWSAHKYRHTHMHSYTNRVLATGTHAHTQTTY